MGAGMMMGGRVMTAGPTEVQRAVQVEMEGGHRLSGRIDLRPLTVETDLGRYAIMPEKIKIIRFLKPENDEAGKAADEQADMNGPQAKARAAMMVARAQNRRNLAMVADPSNPSFPATMARGKVVTTTDKEIIGNIYIPSDFSLEFDFGTLSLAAPKLRSITFTDVDRPAGTADAGTAGAAKGEPSAPPRYFRHEHSVIVVSPAGERVVLYNLETGRSQSVALSGSKDAPLEVTPILGPNLVALALQGPTITRVAVADLASGTWHSQDLREPVRGRVKPVVAPGLAVYDMGRFVYAYGAEAQRWDVAELPEGLQAATHVGPNGATIEDHGQIYTFIPRSGRWEHIDVRTILDVAGAEKKR
jgi:hypothetical protein